MNYHSHSHSVCLLTYHIVFVTKYRKPYITDEIGDFMKEYANYLCERMKCRLISAETDTDHMHLLVSANPGTAPADIVRILKTQIAKALRKKYSEHIEQYIHGDGHYLSSSYFVATTGTTVKDKVKEYIAAQRTDDHKRKYVKSGKYIKKKKSKK